ncbi:MAG: outer membrane lipoprotein-sorting protein [Pseudomonadota bacterium]
MTRTISTLLLALTCTLTARADIPGFAPGNTAEANGLAIAQEADRRGQGFGDSRSTLTMTLYDGRGNSATREMSGKTLEMPDDGDRTLLFFENPRDVAGTAFLTHSHGERDDDQWLYLPALKRIKRIASSNRSGAFMGSEFSYEDLGNDEVEKYEHRYLGEADIDGVATYQLERTPKLKSGYSKQIVWLDQTELRAWRIEYYDRGGRLLKTLYPSDYERYLQRFWRPLTMEMVNHQNGRRTVLEWADYVFGLELPARDFERDALRDIR